MKPVIPKDRLAEFCRRHHMLHVSLQTVAKIKGTSREEFDADENLRLAVTHLIQMIGEAARRVSDETTRAYPLIPWSDIIGMRHKVCTIIWISILTSSGPWSPSISQS